MPLLTRHGEGPYSGGKRMAPRRIEMRTLYNPEKRTAVQIVPALIGVILTMTMVLFTSGAIVRERERGNLELLIATPLGGLELMVGKLLPYVGIGLIQTTLILIVGSLLFSVPVVGRLVDLYAAALLFIAATLGLGLFVSTLAQTQFQAFQLAFVTHAAVDPAVGVHVSVRRHARGGAMDRAGAAAHAFQRDHPRHHAARRRPARGLAAARSSSRYSSRHDAGRRRALQESAWIDESWSRCRSNRHARHPAFRHFSQAHAADFAWPDGQESRNRAHL